MPLPWTEADAHDLAECRATLRAGSRSFDAAAHLLPRAVRDPAIALYAFCRIADDLIDGGEEGRGGEEGGLDWLRARLEFAYDGRPLPVPADRAFARVVKHFAIPRELPEALIEGFAWDAEGRRYRDLPELRAYAVRVAGTVGAMMAVLMGVRDSSRLAAAIDLGVAMQYSNIARDVGEDARAGRLYLPLQWLEEAGIDPDGFLAAPEHSPALGKVTKRLLDAADEHYRRARAGIVRLPLGCRFGIGAAGLLYAEIGLEVLRRDFDSVSGRAIVSARRKAWVLATGLGSVAVSLQPLHGVVMPEAAHLVDAAIHAGLRSVPWGTAIPWWDVPERLRWLLDLFDRLERQERVRT